MKTEKCGVRQYNGKATRHVCSRPAGHTGYHICTKEMGYGSICNHRWKSKESKLTVAK